MTTNPVRGLPAISTLLLPWYDHHGRSGLPWKGHDRYPIWVSEIMLQQTQVTTVIPYFERFMGRFPTVRSLAAASLDDVLALWAGLGYYQRARNLHRAANLIEEQYGGTVPADLESLSTLPGIGRSTAAAIVAFSTGERHAILDGNVRRVLSRYHAVEGVTGRTATERELWTLAEAHTPDQRVADYTQAIMDLGATVCKRSSPLCDQCPLNENCRARRLDRVMDFPVRKTRRAKPLRSVHVVMLINSRGAVLLERRPPTGIWGGLWSLPEQDSADEVAVWCDRHVSGSFRLHPAGTVIRHGFTHFDLDITPWPVTLEEGGHCSDDSMITEKKDLIWYLPGQGSEVGMASPIRRMIESWFASHMNEEKH